MLRLGSDGGSRNSAAAKVGMGPQESSASALSVLGPLGKSQSPLGSSGPGFIPALGIPGFDVLNSLENLCRIGTAIRFAAQYS